MRNLLALLLLIPLVSCGFKPLYKDTTDLDFSNVAVSQIPNEEGVILRNNIIDRLHGSSQSANGAKWTLKLSPIKETTTDLAITKNADATRAQLSAATNMSLKDSSGKIVLRQNLREVTSYNILASEFTNRVSRDAARKAALNGLARQVEEELALYFSSSDARQADSPSR